MKIEKGPLYRAEATMDAELLELPLAPGHTMIVRNASLETWADGHWRMRVHGYSKEAARPSGRPRTLKHEYRSADGPRLHEVLEPLFRELSPAPADATDWRALFRKYSDIVGGADGDDRLVEEDWGPEDWEVIGAERDLVGLGLRWLC